MTTMLIVFIVLVFNGQLAGRKFDDLFVVIFFFIMFPFFVISMATSILNQTYNLSIDDRHLTLCRPIIGTKRIVDISKIKGYSKSEIKFGLGNWGQSLFKSKSIVVYTSEFGPHELIRYNYWDFDKLEKKLQEIGIVFLGFEEYRTGLFFRKYSF